MSNIPHVVILGGGFGGLAAANEIRNTLDSSKVKITIIDKKDWFMVGYAKLWIMNGTRTFENSIGSLNELPKKQINFIKDEIIEINPENNFIKTKSENISFDFLIISMGAVLAPEKIPGLVENGFNLYDHNQLDKIHQKLNKIKNILGEKDYNYAIYADKIAHQIIQTGINFYNGTRDDYSYLSCYKYALQIAVSSEKKNQAQEAIDHSIRIKEEKKCWFCEINEVETGKELRVQMYKYVDVYSGKYTYFKDGGWPVGRCSSCKESHTSFLGDNFLTRTIFGIKKLCNWFRGYAVLDGSKLYPEISDNDVWNHPKTIYLEVETPSKIKIYAITLRLARTKPHYLQVRLMLARLIQTQRRQ